MTKQEEGKKIGKIIAKAWHDDSFKQRLLSDATTVLNEEGVDIPAGLAVRAVENTDSLIHLIIPAKPLAREISAEKLQVIAASDEPFVVNCNCWQGEAWN